MKSISCLQVMKDYNNHGVDLMDSSMSRHKIQLKSRKWTMRLFYHLLDMTCLNAWVLYKQIHKGTQRENIRLVDFKLELADTLFSYNQQQTIKRGRPNLEKQLDAKRNKPNAVVGPPKDSRLDKVGHWPTMDKKGHCKMPNCKGKCKVNLCMTSNNNCFYIYHHF